MKDELQILKNRWTGDWVKLHKAVTEALVNGRSIMKLDCPKTPLGLIDLRGYSAPKDIKRVKSRKGNWNSFVHESIRVKKQRFDHVDFSQADFETCEFFQCHFRHCLFEEVNLKETKFWGCSFEHCIFIKSIFTHAKFWPNRVFFPERMINFKEVVFDHCNLTSATISNQGLEHCQCKQSNTTNLLLHQCRLNDLQLTGAVKGLQLEKNKIQYLDFQLAKLTDLQLVNQSTDGIQFPEGYCKRS